MEQSSIDISVQRLNEMVEQLATLRAEEEALDLERKKLTMKLDTLEGQLMEILEEQGMSSFVSPSGLINLVRKSSVTTPKTLEQKRELFKYLADRGVFEELVSVNSQTLNSFYRAEEAMALERGQFDFNLPGVGQPSVRNQLRFTRSKK